MDLVNEKLKPFINQLLNSSAIKNLAPNEKEESIIAFINQNEDKLSQTFSLAEFFPNADWATIKANLIKAVGEEITSMVLPDIERIVGAFNLDWKKYYGDFLIPDDKFKQQIKDFSSKLVSRYTSRKHISNMIEFFNNNILQQYIMSIYNNHSYIYRGLTRYDDIGIEEPEEALGFLYSAMMILPVYDVSLPIRVIMPQYSGPMGKSISFSDTENNAILRQNFIMKIKEILDNEFPGISPYFIDIISNVFYNADESEEVKYVSKLLKIIYSFATQWRHVKNDRGAESFQASWLNIARTNYKFYSYDLGTLDELYKITIEEGL